MNHPPSDPFLKDTFTGDDLDELRQASLERGLAALRRRRRSRQAASATGVAAVALLFATVWLSRQAAQPNAPATLPHVQIAANPAPVATIRDEIAVSAKATPSGAKILSDDELLALFPHQQVALIGAPGHQQLLVFDDNGDQHAL
jgi:hypothetical protein